MLADSFALAVELLQNARYAVVLTGAGISTPSGIPDFRSQTTGLWARFDPMEVASFTAFRNHPHKVINWLRPLLTGMNVAKPNAAHLALAALERAGLIKAVITQNIDGLHQAAGSQNVLEVHGSLQTMICLRCKRKFPSAQFALSLSEEDSLAYCPVCQAILKPEITLYEEMLPKETWEKSVYHCQQADVMLVVGSSLEVFPVAQLPLEVIEHEGKIIINTISTTQYDQYASVLLPVDVTVAIPRLAEGLL